MKEVTDTERLDAMISEEAHVYNTGDAWKDKTRAWCCATFYDVKHYGLTPRDAIDCLVSQCRRAIEHDNYNRMLQETRAEAKALEAKVQSMVGAAL